MLAATGKLPLDLGKFIFPPVLGGGAITSTPSHQLEKFGKITFYTTVNIIFLVSANNISDE
jgi:hypothetical protein